MAQKRSIIKFRRIAYTKQRGRCYYCGVKMCDADSTVFAKRYAISLRLAERVRCTAEHLEARSDGGCDSEENIVAACRFCNMQRHAGRKVTAVEPYRRHVARRMRLSKWQPPALHELAKACSHRN